RGRRYRRCAGPHADTKAEIGRSPRSDLRGRSDPRKITRNPSLTLATSRDTGQPPPAGLSWRRGGSPARSAASRPGGRDSRLPFIRIKARCARRRRRPAGPALAEETARARAGGQAARRRSALGRSAEEGEREFQPLTVTTGAGWPVW